jgi:predicted ferric reductase
MKRSTKYFLGIFVLCFSISLFILASGLVYQKYTPQLSEINRYTSKVLVMTGVALMSMNFLIATRWRFIEKFFGGFDVSYKVHDLLGRTALVLVMAHPILLSLTALGNATGFLSYYIPGSILAYNLGMFALWLFIILVVITIFIKLPYHIWKFFHMFMGFAFFIAFAHALNTQSYITPYLPFKVWTYGMFVLGLVSGAYKSFLYKYLAPGGHFTVKAVKQLGDITEIWFEPADERSRALAAKSKAGQYFFLSIHGNPNVSPEEHPYSLSAIETDAEGNPTRNMRLSVKSLGDHSKLLPKLEVGDRARFVGPFGFFSATHARATGYQIWLAGGVGVTPFLSMLQHEHDLITKQGIDPVSRPRIHIFYGTKVETEAVYDQEISALVTGLGHVNLHKHYTDANGFMSADWIMEQAGTKDTELPFVSVLQCGPPGMMKALEKQFLDKGLDPARVIYEEFSFKA